MYVHRWMLIALLIAAALCIGYDIREVAAQNGAPELPFTVPEYPEPEDNAWDYIVQATEVLKETDGARGSTLVLPNTPPGGEPDYAAAAACYAYTFDVLRQGLYNECRMPNVTDIEALFPRLASCREMARGLSYEARAHFASGRPDRGVDSIRDCLRLGRNLTVNGALIHSLVAIAIDAIAADALTDGIRQQRPSEEKLLGFVEWNEQNRESRQSTADTFAVDAATHARVAPGTPEQLREYLDYMARVIEWAGQPVHLRGAPPMRAEGGDGLNAEIIARHAEKMATAAAVRRGLSVMCAIEAYRAHTGAYPDALSALAPDYILAMPLDPFSGRGFRYVGPQDGDDTYLLYSIGPDMADDFAILVWNRTTRDGDLILGPEWQIHGYRDPAGVPGPPPPPAPPPPGGALAPAGVPGPPPPAE